MLNISKLVAGRRYSFVHNSDVETVEQRDGIFAPSWLKDLPIVRRAVFSGNTATAETYTRAQLKENPDYERSGRSWFAHHPTQAGIVLHKKTRKPYLCVLNPRTQKADYLVGGQPATPEQVATIKAFKKNRSKGIFAVYDIDKVECKGEVSNEVLEEDIAD